MQEYDKSSKWLIQRHGESILRLGGVRGIQTWKALQAELILTRRLPDGLIEAKLRGRKKPARFLLEISTCPYRRLSKRAIEGLCCPIWIGEKCPRCSPWCCIPADGSRSRASRR
jgi:hypothetical protein